MLSKAYFLVLIQVVAIFAETNESNESKNINSLKGVVEETAWPVAFRSQCSNLRKSILNLKQFDVSSCPPDKQEIIKQDHKCEDGILGLIDNVFWPVAFDKQLKMGKQLDAITECLVTQAGGTVAKEAAPKEQ